MTLGGQYDWTAKAYPAGPPPSFPQDIKILLETLFPMKAEAAITNVYSPGDTLAVHRDVSEACEQPLVSISLGCECLFVVGVDDEVLGKYADSASGVASHDKSFASANGTKNVRMLAIKLRSGDALLMSGAARFAWHGVPRIVAESCPEGLREWPAVGGSREGRFEGWREWLGGKRVNFNVRQMFDDDRDAGDETMSNGGEVGAVEPE